ncbi:MAG: SAM-dependent chlorinase/fluorinase [Planctomycetota bacterium]|nr:SAM-dependent chlorinase/fluorinase [Planctomycetota bacterium]
MPARRTAPPRPVVLMTDFGPGSVYVGQIKLALARAAPGVPVVDLAHDLPAHDVAAAALVLEGARHFLPAPAVLCAVVDPGVGSERALLAVTFPRGLVALAPDNGLLAPWIAAVRPVSIHAVTRRAWFHRRVSPVFHGRDAFAPTAARLALGEPAAKAGPRLKATALAPSPWHPLVRSGWALGARIVYVDPFGNLITNIHERDLPPGRTPVVRIGGRRLKWAGHYAAVPRGVPLALIGSFGFLEIAVREASAAAALNLGKGDSVSVSFKD